MEDPVVAAYDQLHACTARLLARQVHLLTGDPELTRRAVDHAFRLAWQRWSEVAVDPDPPGWLRAAAHEYALSPWRQVPRRPRHWWCWWPRGWRWPRWWRWWRPAPPVLDPHGALLALPPARRRAVLLYDGLGLDLPETAAELEATTPAAAGRITRAHEELVLLVPELAGADPHDLALPTRIGGLLARVSAGLPEAPFGTPAQVRAQVEQLFTRTALATAALVAAVVLPAGAFVLLDALDGGSAPPPVRQADPAPPRPG
ncbi:hypothetical protein GCM10027168_63750 [Streptomyces capparidis]